MKRIIIYALTITSIAFSSFLGCAFLGINRNGKKPIEIINPKDSSVLMEVSAGSFIMGSNDGNNDEKPEHKVFLEKYYIGKYEVTNAQYKMFCDATGHTQPYDPGFSGMPNYFISYPNYPVVRVNWFDAKAYCDWAGLRLPTEAEWEKAARGTDGRKYPWGNEWDSTKCNSGEFGDIYNETSPIGSFPSGVSPNGVYDMAGNVLEWCNDYYEKDYYCSSPSRNPYGPSSGYPRVSRGGSWFDSKHLPSSARTRHFSARFPVCVEFWLGFRVAK
jgi:sulfatase modifying factor 1